MLYQWNSRWLSSYTMKWWYFGVSELQQKKELRVVTHQAARKTRQITWLCPKVKGHSRPNYNLFGSDGWDVGDIPPHVDLVDEVEAFETLHPHSSEIDSNALGLCPAKDPKIVFFFGAAMASWETSWGSTIYTSAFFCHVAGCHTEQLWTIPNGSEWLPNYWKSADKNQLLDDHLSADARKIMDQTRSSKFIQIQSLKVGAEIWWLITVDHHVMFPWGNRTKLAPGLWQRSRPKASCASNKG